MTWIQPASRALTENGSLFICGYPEILANVQRPALEHFEVVRWTQWHYKNRANLGSDWGRSHESILHFRKTKTFKLANIDYLRGPYGEHTKNTPPTLKANPLNMAIKQNQPTHGPRTQWVPNQKTS